MVIRRGTSGSDTLIGTTSNDTLYGLRGNDTLDSGDDNDLIYGGAGADTLRGGDGTDVLIGSGALGVNDTARDVLFGGDGNDSLEGRDVSYDLLRGGAGDDRLYVNNDDAAGGDGNDLFRLERTDGRLTGGAGSDDFEISYWHDGEANSTVITDFGSEDRMVGVGYFDDAYRFFYSRSDLFGMLDVNGDASLDGSDGFSTTAEGIHVGVGRAGPAITIYLGEDRIRFENVAAIASTDWV